MAIADLQASLTLDYGDYKSSLKSAQQSMEDAAKTTKSAMGTVSEETKKSQGIFSSAFNKMADSGDNFKNQQASLVGTIGKTAAAFVGIKSAADLFNSAIARVDKIQSAEKAIESLTGSNKDAKIVMEGLQKVVDGTPLSLDSFTASAKGMIAAGMDANKVEPIMRAVGDAAYGVGNGAESIDIMASAFKSLQASGTASLGDLNRLMDQNIPVYKILGNQLEMSTEDMKKYISDGLLPAGEAMDLLAKGIEEGTDGINGSTASMAGQMETAGTTIAGAAGNIKTAFVKSLAVPITESYDKIVNGMIAVKDGIKAMQPQMEIAFTAISQIIEGVVLGIVDTFNILKPAIKVVTEIFKEFTEYIKKFLPEGTNLTDVVRKLTPLLIGMFVAFQAYKHIAMAASTFRIMSSAIKGSSEAMGALGKVSKLLVKSFRLITAHPIVAVITALGTALVVAYNKSETFRNGVNSLLKPLKRLNILDAFGTGISGIGKAFSGIKFDSVSSGFNGISDSIKNIDFTSGFDQIVKGFSGITSAISSNSAEIGKGIGELIGGILTAIGNALPDIVAGGLSIVTGLIQGLANGAAPLIIAAGELIVNIIRGITIALPQIIVASSQLILTFIIGLTSELPKILLAGTDLIVELVKGITNSIPKVVPAVIETVTTFLNTLALHLPELIAAGANVLVNFLQGITENLPKVASTVTSLVTTFLTELANNLPSIISGGVDVIVALLQGIASNLPRVVSAAVDVTVSFLQGIANNIGRIISAGLDVILAFVKGIGDNAQRVVDEVFEVLNKVAYAVGTSPGKMVEVGMNLIQGIVDGITGAWHKVTSAVDDVIQGIKDKFDFKLSFPDISIPHISLPHFSMSGNFSLNPPSVPSLSVDWYATGGIATAPSIVGIGEAGDEAIVPLSNKGRMKPFAQAVSAMINRDSNGNKSSASDTIIVRENTFVVREEADIDRIAEALHRKAKREKV